jgi:hypothetical protein
MSSSRRLATVTDVGTSVGDSACNPAPRGIFAPSDSARTPDLDADTFLSLEALSRKAANDSLQAKGGHLADDQFDSLAVHMLEIGARAFGRFDPELTVSDRDGFSFAYRAMRGYRGGRFTEGPYIDWLRSNVRDSRFEPEGSTSVTETGELPERPALDPESFERAVEDASASLSSRALWTLHHVMRPIATEGKSRVLVALEVGIPLAEVFDRLDELESELREAA